MIVENISGTSEFTVDPRRHMIMENRISLPQDLQPTGVLPDQRTANILINSYFINVCLNPSYEDHSTHDCRPQVLLKSSIKMRS